MPILPVRMSGPSSCEWDGTGLHLVRRHGGTPGEGQQDEERGEPFMQVHCIKTLFLTLPTRGLTGEATIASAG